jgi:hypothetical protein
MKTNVIFKQSVNRYYRHRLDYPTKEELDLLIENIRKSIESALKTSISCEITYTYDNNNP